MLFSDLQWVDDMADAGADQYTFHLEATSENIFFLTYHPQVLYDTVIFLRISQVRAWPQKFCPQKFAKL